MIGVFRASRLALFLVVLATALGCRKQSATPAASASAPPGSQPRELRIAAASDLKFALDRIATEFRRDHPQTTVQITYGSSGNFYSQLANKAPFDIFLSADISYPQKLIEAGLAERAALFRYAVGRIVIWTPNTSPLDVQKLGFEALQDKRLLKIAIANPAHAPYGRAAQAALEYNKLWEPLQPRLVFGENIAQTAQYVQTGAADAGIIALSLALAPAMKSSGQYFLVSQEEYPPLEQAGLILSWAQDRADAEAFQAYLTGPAGQSILRDFGFDSPKAR